MTQVRLEPAALRSRVKHSTTEPLPSINKMLVYRDRIHKMLLRITNREDPDQTDSVWQANGV